MIAGFSPLKNGRGDCLASVILLKPEVVEVHGALPLKLVRKDTQDCDVLHIHEAALGGMLDL